MAKSWWRFLWRITVLMILDQRIVIRETIQNRWAPDRTTVMCLCVTKPRAKQTPRTVHSRSSFHGYHQWGTRAAPPDPVFAQRSLSGSSTAAGTSACRTLAADHSHQTSPERPPAPAKGTWAVSRDRTVAGRFYRAAPCRTALPAVSVAIWRPCR